MKSILDKLVSFFPSVDNPGKSCSVNLLNLLESAEFESLVSAVRVESDPVIQKKLKDKLPCFTVSGTFSHRSEQGLISLSGLAAVDLDSAEGYDVIHLLGELRKIKFIAYAGLSCRGKRLFAVVPFLHPAKYQSHYERLIRSFNDIGLPMGDTCHKSISQARFVSFNTSVTCFFNHHASPYHLLNPVKIIHHLYHRSPANASLNSPGNPFKWCEEQVSKSNSFSNGNRHKFLVSLARYCNLKGIPEPDTLSGCMSSYCAADFPESEITKIVSHVYDKHADSHNKIPFHSLADNKTTESKHKKSPADNPSKKSQEISKNYLQSPETLSAENHSAQYNSADSVSSQSPVLIPEISLSTIPINSPPLILSPSHSIAPSLPHSIASSPTLPVWLITSSSGKVYKPLPGGNTEVFATMPSFLAGNPPVSLISFSEWSTVKAAEDWLMNNFITK